MAGLLGVLINPVAGIGGPVGLKGSDGPEIVRLARSLGGESQAGLRAAAALRAFAGSPAGIVTAAGAMGADVCAALGLRHRIVSEPGAATGAADTRRAVEACRTAGADLVLFVGGDGTARDVADCAGKTPILGVPAGVKMYSAVFATSPPMAGQIAARFLALDPAARRVDEAELLDLDEARLRRDEPATRLYGVAHVPASPAVQRAKAAVPPNDDGQIDALCRGLAERIEPDCLYVVGPGRTARAFLAACGLPKTLLGVDLMVNRRIVGADASERQILSLQDHAPSRIVIGLLGGQGCLFGRGNQPIGARVIARTGLDRILVLAGAAKVASLPQGLFVDTGDEDLDRRFEGFVRIETGPGRSTLLRVRPQGFLGR